MTPFALARMRHLDLLALYHRLHPDSRDRDALVLARLSKDALAAAVFASRQDGARHEAS